MKRIVFAVLTVLLFAVSIIQVTAKNADAVSINDEQGSSRDKYTNKNEKKDGDEQYLRKSSSIEARKLLKGEGEGCLNDYECEGYCELGLCYDGSEGDRCQQDSDCQPGLDCDWTNAQLICKKKKSEGQFCWTDDECEGYCELGKCYDGSEGDPCQKDSDCQGYCELGKCYDGSEGDRCNNDSDCKGYCELGRCYDGSVGDRCQKDSDCQSGLDCDWQDAKLICKKKKGEGRFCWSDSECAGYCHDLKCWDGSRGDRCGSNRDCKSRRCKCTSWFCTRKRCR